MPLNENSDSVPIQVDRISVTVALLVLKKKKYSLPAEKKKSNVLMINIF